MRYASTRGGACDFDARQAVLQGIAPDGGLFAQDVWPDLSKAGGTDFIQTAKQVFAAMLPGFTKEETDAAAELAYGSHFDDAGEAPLKRAGDMDILELFHGPTAAFKDVALRALPPLMGAARDKGSDLLILTATSGDTGSAAMSGFANVPGIRVMAFYPTEGVSPVQKAQMQTMAGGNITAVGLRGDFDDAQRGVKEILSLGRIGRTLLSSANSINIGRLVPQMTYYITAIRCLQKEGRMKNGETVDFAVPTGNFGDVLAGYMAKRCGLPIGRLIVATNANDVLNDFLLTGIYDRRRPLAKTLSPSMDILVSGNLERLLYFESGGDGFLVRGLMEKLKTDGWYCVPDSVMRGIRKTFDAGSVGDRLTLVAIRQVWEEDRYLMDPHTAAACHVMRLKKGHGPCVVLATASPFKFPLAISEALGIDLPMDASAPEAMGETLGLPVPRSLSKLHTKMPLHTDVIDWGDMRAYVEEKAAAW